MTKKELNDIIKAGDDLVSSIENANYIYIATHAKLTPHMQFAIQQWKELRNAVC